MKYLNIRMLDDDEPVNRFFPPPGRLLASHMFEHLVLYLAQMQFSNRPWSHKTVQLQTCTLLADDKIL